MRVGWSGGFEKVSQGNSLCQLGPGGRREVKVRIFVRRQGCVRRARFVILHPATAVTLGKLGCLTSEELGRSEQRATEDSTKLMQLTTAQNLMVRIFSRAMAC